MSGQTGTQTAGGSSQGTGSQSSARNGTTSGSQFPGGSSGQSGSAGSQTAGQGSGAAGQTGQAQAGGAAGQGGQAQAGTNGQGAGAGGDSGQDGGARQARQGGAGAGGDSNGQQDGAGGAGAAWPDGVDPGQAGSGQGSEAFERSLEEFDQILSEEQETIARSGGGTAADRSFGQQAGGTGNVVGAPAGDGQGGSVSAPEGGGNIAGAGGSAAPGEQHVFRSDVEEPAKTVEGCEDEDKVARQLCEAATAEKDPFLRSALWDEYNEYKKILVRQ